MALSLDMLLAGQSPAGQALEPGRAWLPGDAFDHMVCDLDASPSPDGLGRYRIPTAVMAAMLAVAPVAHVAAEELPPGAVRDSGLPPLTWTRRALASLAPVSDPDAPLVAPPEAAPTPDIREAADPRVRDLEAVDRGRAAAVADAPPRVLEVVPSCLAEPVVPPAPDAGVSEPCPASRVLPATQRSAAAPAVVETGIASTLAAIAHDTILQAVAPFEGALAPLGTSKAQPDAPQDQHRPAGWTPEAGLHDEGGGERLVDPPKPRRRASRDGRDRWLNQDAKALKASSDAEDQEGRDRDHDRGDRDSDRDRRDRDGDRDRRDRGDDRDRRDRGDDRDRDEGRERDYETERRGRDASEDTLGDGPESLPHEGTGPTRAETPAVRPTPPPGRQAEIVAEPYQRRRRTAGPERERLPNGDGAGPDEPARAFDAADAVMDGSTDGASHPDADATGTVPARASSHDDAHAQHAVSDDLDTPTRRASRGDRDRGDRDQGDRQEDDRDRDDRDRGDRDRGDRDRQEDDRSRGDRGDRQEDDRGRGDRDRDDRDRDDRDRDDRDQGDRQEDDRDREEDGRDDRSRRHDRRGRDGDWSYELEASEDRS